LLPSAAYHQVPRFRNPIDSFIGRPNLTGKADNPEAQRRRAIESLVAGSSRSAAASAAGVTERTLRRWASSDDFAAALRAAYDESFTDALRVLRGSAIDAVRALREVASDRDAPPAARVGAARVILEEARAAVELDEVGARLSALERQLATGGATGSTAPGRAA
jgi:hypothetical protein